MKKAFVILLALAMLLSNALAQSVEVGGGVENPEVLALSLNKVYVTENWQGVENSTHAWIVLEVEITKYSTSVLPLDKQLSASLVYDSRYTFEAERHFELKEIEPLVQISGALLFKVPKTLTKVSDCWDYLSVYELDGKCYVHTCTIVKYLRGWKILRLISNLLGNDLSSEVMPLEEYGAALAEPEYVLTWKDGSADPAKALKEVDTSPLIGRWKASTEDTMEFMEFMELREGKTCLVSQDGEAMEGVWNANSLCIVFGESIRSLKSCLYTLEGSKLTLTFDSEQYVFERT